MEKAMAEHVGADLARSFVVELDIQVMRLALKKAPSNTFGPGVAGVYTEEKRDTIVANWYRWVQKQHSALTEFAEEMGVNLDEKGKAEEEVHAYIHNVVLCT